jgi:transcriptional regulator GlxA family with amidase domain
LLAKAGLLKDCNATMYHSAFDHLKALSSTTTLINDARLVQSSPKIFTSGGICAGIDLALHAVGISTGPSVHEDVIEQMKYRR